MDKRTIKIYSLLLPWDWNIQEKSLFVKDDKNIWELNTQSLFFNLIFIRPLFEIYPCICRYLLNIHNIYITTLIFHWGYLSIYKIKTINWYLTFNCLAAINKIYNWINWLKYCYNYNMNKTKCKIKTLHSKQIF